MIPPSQARGITGTLGLHLTSERDNKGELGGTEPTQGQETKSRVRLVTEFMALAKTQDATFRIVRRCNLPLLARISAQG